MRILYLYLNPGDEKLQKILDGEIPSNHLCGYVELKKLGYDISFMDTRPKGPLRAVTKFFNDRFGFNLKDMQTLLQLNSYDVIVVKGSFSTALTLACKFFNKKIVYLDTILRHPKNLLRKFIYSLNLRLASGTIMYSEHQMNLCAELFNVPKTCFKLIPFAIDMPFFKKRENSRLRQNPFILSVGQDLARDYKTLVEAVKDIHVDLKLVTLPYLLNGLDINRSQIEILNKLSYDELFQLYADALFVVIPLKCWGTEYSSGTTSLLEAKALGKAVVATRSNPMMEYLDQGEGVVYVDPEDSVSLREAMINMMTLESERMSLEEAGMEKVRERFDMKVFAVEFGMYLKAVYDDLAEGVAAKEV